MNCLYDWRLKIWCITKDVHSISASLFDLPRVRRILFLASVGEYPISKRIGLGSIAPLLHAEPELIAIPAK
jgi:hypothetical protein